MLPSRPLLLLFALCGFLNADSSRAQDSSLPILEERAVQQATAKADPSIVRIETVGGVDLIGEMVAASGPTTGVVIDSEGWIITSSFNFAAKPTSIFVATHDGQRYPATMAGRDESRRLTLLKIEAAGLKPITPVPVSEFKVGQWAIALGRTYDLNFPNLALGIVSALGRISGRALQTDANTSPVNYGGPLIDIEGRGLGVIVPLSPQGDSVTAGVEYYDSGIGFAVPVVDVLAVLDRLKAGETLKPGKLGILYTDQGLLTEHVQVDRILPRSPAEAAGLKVGDVITAFGGQAIPRASTLKQLLGPHYGGDQVVVTVQRNDQTLELPVTLANEIEPVVTGFLGVVPSRAKNDAPGHEEPAEGVLIQDVLPDFPAAQAGLKPGDRVATVEGEKISNTMALTAALRKKVAGDKVSLDVVSGETARSVTVTLSPFPTSVPTELPAQHIPSPPEGEGVKKRPRTGRLMEKFPGDERQFWMYVPEHYNSEFTYGLVVWLHPEGDSREGATLEAWRSTCEERGLILIGPGPVEEKWTPPDLPLIVAAVAKAQSDYSIDRRRVVLVGEGLGGLVAMSLGLQQQNLFSGAAAVGTVLPAEMPESEQPFPLHISAFSEKDDAGRIERSVEPFQEAKRPIIFTRWPGEGENGLSEADAGELGRWIELLGCL